MARFTLSWRAPRSSAISRDDIGQDDVCRVLEIGDAASAARRLDDDEKGPLSIPTLGGAQEMLVISESGLYSLILTSRKPAAVADGACILGGDAKDEAGLRQSRGTKTRSFYDFSRVGVFSSALLTIREQHREGDGLLPLADVAALTARDHRFPQSRFTAR